MRVVHTPISFHIHSKPADIRATLQTLKSNDALAVYGVGNSNIFYPHTSIFHQESLYWNDNYMTYQETETFFQSGYAIMASYAMEKPATFKKFLRSAQWYVDKTGDVEYLREMYRNADKYIRHPNIIPFGDLKEYGFTVFSSKPSFYPCTFR